MPNVASTDVNCPIPHLDELPDEVIQNILIQLDAPSLLAISLTSRHLRSVASEQLLWKKLIISDFQFWDRSEGLNEKLKDSSFIEWRELYAVRHTASLATRSAIRRIISSSQYRIATANRALNHGYGIKDALLHLYENAPAECALAQKYWSRCLVQCANRSKALDAWNLVKFRTDIENPMELALSGLDMFMLGPEREGDIEDTFRRLDSYADSFCSACPELETLSPRKKAIAVAEFLRKMKWVGIDESRDYYSMENQFLGYALRSRHRNSLPLVSCVIYCYVLRKVGLRAAPCTFPGHVYAVVQPSDGDGGLKEDVCDLDGNVISKHKLVPHPAFAELDFVISEQTHLYMDPFNTSEPVPVNDLVTRLRFVDPGADTTTRANYLLPATARQLLVRAAHNIINSINSNAHRNQQSHNAYDAAYAALFALVMFPPSPHALASNLNDLQHHFINHYAEDLRNYEMYLQPTRAVLTGKPEDPTVRVVRAEDAKPRVAKLRSDTVTEVIGGQKEVVKYTVGTVFKHRRQEYRAVIYGWDGKCEMAERWIVGNGVDRLPKGRSQPFYNVYVEDQSTRYVAQENVEPLGPEEFTAEDAENAFGVEAGKWFLRFDPKTARFVSNVQEEYPED